MACSTKKGPRAFLNFIKETTGEDVSQAEWHAIKKFAALDSYSPSRAVINSVAVKATVDELSASLQPYTQAKIDARATLVKELESEDCKVTQGTQAVVLYLAEYGVKDTLARIRAGKGGWHVPPPSSVRSDLEDIRSSYARYPADDLWSGNASARVADSLVPSFRLWDEVSARGDVSSENRLLVAQLVAYAAEDENFHTFNRWFAENYERKTGKTFQHPTWSSKERDAVVESLKNTNVYNASV